MYWKVLIWIVFNPFDEKPRGYQNMIEIDDRILKARNTNG